MGSYISKIGVNSKHVKSIICRSVFSPIHPSYFGFHRNLQGFDSQPKHHPLILLSLHPLHAPTRRQHLGSDTPLESSTWAGWDMKITQYIHNNQQQTTTHFRLLHSPNSRGIQIQTHVESTNPFTTTAHTEGLNDWRGPNFLAHQFLQRPAECHRSWSNRTDGSVRKQETNKMAIKTSNNGDTYFSKRWDRNWVVHPLFIFFR
jgi:hypothetical protein